MPMPESTLEGMESQREARRALWGKRVFLSLLLAFALAGLVGALGVRSTSTTGSGEGYELTLRHAAVARAGLDVPWEVTVTKDGGFDETLTLAVTGDYFDIYETQGFAPEPAAATRDRDTLYLSFTAPEGETFVLAYDAYIQPSSQRGADGSVSVVVDGGERVATVEFETFLLP